MMPPVRWTGRETKNENFSVQRSARPEQPGHKAPNQPTDIAHNIEYHPIRRRSSAIWVCGRDSPPSVGCPFYFK
jgi:hypothetical protein